MEALWGLGSLALIFFAFLISKIYTYIQKENLHRKVASCINGRVDGSLLLDAIYNAQHELNISQPYQLALSEKDSVSDILQLHNKALNRNYFHENLLCSRYVIKMSDKEYFMFSLYSFLNNHQYDDSLDGRDVLVLKRKEILNSTTEGAQRYYAEYTLTDFGITFRKMQYISSLYCETNAHLNSKNAFYGSDNLKEALDQREIQITKF